MRYASKQALLSDVQTEHDRLCARLAEIPKARWLESGVWGEGWTLSTRMACEGQSLATFMGPNTASHYRFALKVVKRWLKGTAAVRPSAPSARR